MQTKRIDIEKYKKQQEDDVINTISQSLKQAENESQAQLPETIFKHYFLPMFLGEKTDPSINEGVWAGIAGNPYRSVEIIDDAGQVLFIVPPLFLRERIDPSRRDINNSPLSHVMETLQQLARISPIKANRYLESELNKRPIHQEALNGIRQVIEAWDKIFAFYKIPIHSAEEEKKESKDQHIPLDFGDELL